MSWRRPLALFLALVLLVSASGAATLCIEADGSAKVELVAALCCDDTSAQTRASSETGSSFAPVSPCSGCDDRPLDEARWTRTTHDVVIALPAPSLVCTILLPPEPPVALCEHDRALAGSPPSPRAERPSILRC
ncbi:MAG: hypothetical protein AB7T63_17050 [Planctomycetota bacterium]